MKQVLIGHGGVTVEDVPAPGIEPGRILVQIDHSCISVGTEMSGVRAGNQPLWKRALRNPAEMRKVLDRVRSSGLSEARDVVQRKLKTLHPIGYSASGTVIGVGEGVSSFVAGDKVACAGTHWASHAEYVSVPENLAVRMPDWLDFRVASTVTLGAIALQGIRRAGPTLGETFLVIGLGMLGQLTQRMLHANGVCVIGLDVKQDRIAMAKANGLAHALDPGAPDLAATAYRLTDGHGVDGVIVTAASASDAVLSTAFQCCRKKGRVILVGDVGLDIRREDIYAKELDFLVSTSYGPGRYDRRYEEEGIDYPIGYVRWTETRNMDAYLRLIAEARIDISDLVTRVFPVDSAPAAYASLEGGENAPLAMLLDYGRKPIAAPAALGRTFANPAATVRGGAVRLGLIGAGGFATGTLLPIVAKHPKLFSLTTIVTRQGVSATNAARQFGAARASTDIEAVLGDPDTDAVMIATRHDRHGPLVLRALEAGKHVFVEKPLCLTEPELAAIEAFYAARGQSDGPLLMTGFNRRFAPTVAALRARTAARAAPMMINYRVNAGFLPPDAWVHGPEGGGRNLGEACHFYDFFTALTGAKIKAIAAVAINPSTKHHRSDDNFMAHMAFEDGSIATLTYSALGNRSVPKERIEVFCDGQVYEIEDFKSFRPSDGVGAISGSVRKGHAEGLVAFAEAILGRAPWPIPLWQQFQATRIALDVERRIGGPA